MENVRAKVVKIAIAGYGVVGKATLQTLSENKYFIKNNTGLDIVVKTVFSRNIDSKSDKYLDSVPVKTTDIDVFLDDPEIDIVVEVMGGLTLAKDIITKAIKKSKRVVTANKALLANYGDVLFKCKTTDIGFEASVGGGIPIIKVMKESLSANRIDSISAILNGTCNYILTKMTKDGLDFAEVLKEAQDKGYAEADPTFDIEGIDTAHKICILASIAFHNIIPLDKIFVNGISNIISIDIALASNLGYTVKLLAEAKNDNNYVDISVFPTMIKNDFLISKVDYAFNVISVKGDKVGESLYYGSGAGGNPTSSAVVSDIMTIARDKFISDALRVPLLGYYENNDGIKIRDIKELVSKFYIRFSVKDNNAGNIMSIFEKHSVAISNVFIKKYLNKSYSIFVTEDTRFGVILDILQEAKELSKDNIFIMRIKD